MEDEIKTEAVETTEAVEQENTSTEAPVSETDNNDVREMRDAMREMQSDIREIKHNAAQPGMKWFKFLIYFALFAGAVLNLIFGILAVTGAQYTISGVEAELVYETFPGMKGADVFYGIMGIILAVFGVVTRFMLSSYRKIGPIFLYVLYGVGILINIIYIAIASSVVGQAMVDASTIGSLLGSAVMIGVNIVYFQKRKHLFVK